MRAVELIVDDGRVIGVRFETGDGGPVEVGARRGVVIATGGFEWDAELVRAFIRGPLARSASVPDQHRRRAEDGHARRRRARQHARGLVGADRSTSRSATGSPGWQVNGERTRPHCIMVNRLGQRFTNEAANYNALGAAFHVIDVSTFDYVNHPAWLVFDRHYLTRYGLAGFKGDGPDAGMDHRGADDRSKLAAGDRRPAPTPCEAHVARWNEQSARGRGRRLRPRQQRPRPVVGRPKPRRRAAGDDRARWTPRRSTRCRSTPACSARRAGPRTDGDGQVLDVDGRPIAGLYAAGNAMASVMGMTYGGAGGTLGPALVFGYLPAATPHTPSSRRRHDASEFTGKVALVTGAAGGMGRATALGVRRGRRPGRRRRHRRRGWQADRRADPRSGRRGGVRAHRRVPGGRRRGGGRTAVDTYGGSGLARPTWRRSRRRRDALADMRGGRVRPIGRREPEVDLPVHEVRDPGDAQPGWRRDRQHRVDKLVPPAGQPGRLHRHASTASRA